MTTGSSGRGRIAGVVLAAGASTRMGRIKQLLPFRGKPLLQHAVDAATADLEEVVLVLGHAADEILAALELPERVRTVTNPAYGEGQSTSLRVGLAALGPEVEGAVLLLGDQPGLPPSAIRDLSDRFRHGSRDVIRAEYDGVPGHPVILPRSIWPEVMAGTGDLGARAWIAAHPDRVLHFPIPTPLPLEVDTEDDYRRLLEEG